MLSFTDFRNFESHTIENVNEGMNLLIEPNGTGKSNVLEAIYLLSTGHSPRVRNLRESIRWDQPLARVSGKFGNYDRAVVIQKTSKSLLINGQKVPLHKFLQTVLVTYFQPEDLQLLIGGPARRRLFLDRIFSQFDAQYVYDLIQFRKHLNSRNSLLKGDQLRHNLLDVVEEQMTFYAARIMDKRHELIQHLSEMTEEHGIHIEYVPSPKRIKSLLISDKEVFSPMRGTFGELDIDMQDPSASSGQVLQEYLRKKYKLLRAKEHTVGFSLCGPQRDDIQVYARDDDSPDGWKELGTYGSRGQQRMAIFHLKMAEREVYKVESGIEPILLLDDVLSELDEQNQADIVSLARLSQLFISAAREGDIPIHLLQDYSRIRLR